MISKTSEYALRAMVAMRKQGPGARVLNRDLSALTGIPKNYLSKIMHALGRAGFVISGRGPNGGFGLCPNAGAITVFQIVALFEDLDRHRRCLLGERDCGESFACPAHEGWKVVRDAYERFLNETTLDILTASPPAAEMRPVQTRKEAS